MYFVNAFAEFSVLIQKKNPKNSQVLTKFWVVVQSKFECMKKETWRAQ